MKSPHSFNIGKFNAFVFSDQRNKRSLKWMFSRHPEHEIQAYLDKNNVEDETQSDGNVLYFDTGEHKVLVDSGIGFGDLIEGMASEGITPKEIDYLIITHGDGDHILGLLDKEGKSIFPNARIVMWEKAWESWTTPAGQKEMVEDFEIVMKRWDRTEEEIQEMRASRPDFGNITLMKLQSQLTLVDLQEEIIPGVHLIDARGHRRDMVAVVISSEDDAVIHVSDSLRHPIQAIHPHYTCYIDTYVEMMVPLNKKLFALAVGKNALMFCTHLEHPGLAKITQGEKGWLWENVQ